MLLLAVNRGSFPPKQQFSTFPSNKGYFPAQAGGLDYYYTQPVNAQYWTGPPATHIHAPHYKQPLYQPYPNQFGLWNQPQTGLYPWNAVQYPTFDANYWTGAHFNPNYYGPVYPQPHPVYQHPVYHPQTVYHPAYYQRAMYPGHYLYHPAPFGSDPYKQRGFFGGTGQGLAKGLLGALLVGVVAGAVARRGK